MSNLPSVMVVDDEEELAQLFMELLKGSGFDTVSFTDPLLALKHFQGDPKKYSLIITDFNMPDLNGLDLAKKIRNYNSNTKILLIAGSLDDEYLGCDELREAAISEVMQKPVRLKELRTRVDNICSHC
jgi:DNA-binding response OmpR family regulator